ncbi:MAG TPA: DNA polymerase III subunit delta' [Hyphomicrobiaceae bacterium]|nr:DNA polymerase III subunit delta' [Hyphomicrobiaceae bacterium]
MARAQTIADVEALPEADRLDGAPHPRETGELVGHVGAEAELEAAFRSRRMHHAWILGGPAGIGKATLAYRFARYLLAAPEERPEAGLAIPQEARTSRLVRQLAHPRLAVIRRTYDAKTKRFPASIPVDEVRRLRAFLGHTAGEGEWRVVIIDTADELNVNAANAVLKSLEEPPPRTLFLLVSSEPGRLLVTIRSRCRTLMLAPLSGADLRKASEGVFQDGRPIPPEDWPRLEILANGSVRRLLGLLESEGLAQHAAIMKLLTSLPVVDWTAVEQLADQLTSPQAEQRFTSFYDLLLDEIARLVRAAGGVSGSAEGLALAAKLGVPARLATWAGVWETVVRSKAETLALNLDRRTLIIETISRLQSAARP